MRRIVFLVFLALFFPFSGARAQLSLPPIDSLVSLNAESESFAPETVVRLTANSFSLDLAAYTLRWLQNGSVIKEGVGATSATARLGKSGEETRIILQVFENNTFITEARATLTPASVDIIWEGSGYTHPFYKGRALPSSGGSLSAEARPIILTQDGFIIPNSRLIFTWSLNGRILGSLSGLGKSAVQLPVTDFSGEDTLEVSVRSTESAGQASSKVRVPSQSPHLTLYRIDPLLGVDFLNAIQSEDLVGDSESAFTVVPYYLGVKNLKDTGISLEWEVNGIRVDPHSDDQFSLTLVSPSDSILARIKATISLATSYTGTERTWKVLFKTPQSSFVRDLFSRPVE